MHNHELKLLQDETKAHVDTQATLDTYKESAVDAFNEKMKTFDKRGEELNKIGDKIEEDRGEYDAMVLASNQRCAGIVVSYSDMRAVAKERAKKK